MESIQTDIKAQAIELSQEAFSTFCEDISGMFEIDMECNFQEDTDQTVSDLKKKFKKLTAVNSVSTEGAMNGTFQLIFDQNGLFTLAGTIVMLPEQRIIQNCKTGSEKNAEEMKDAIKEAGNMLVGSWDRVFREGMDSHKHFVQSDTFIGKPWDKSEETIKLQKDQEVTFVSYKMTIGSYPEFDCGVIFPKSIFEPVQPADAPEAESEQPLEPENTEDKKVPEDTADQNPEPKAAEPEPATVEKPVSNAIKDIVQSGNTSSGNILNITAEQIMDTKVVWATSGDTVEHALNLMQQNNISYIMIGQDNTLEGIVSRSDLNGAVSIYLKPVFSKWHRPLDDATLQIKLRWIMSRPIQTITPTATVSVIINNMLQMSHRALPVIDPSGKIAGIVTYADIFKATLGSDKDTNYIGEVSQAVTAPPSVTQ